MYLPSQLDLPFFTYGLFRPEQIGYQQLKPHVAKANPGWTVKGLLLERDGLPVLDEGENDVSGVLIHFKSGMGLTAYEVIASNEPEKLYRWKVVEVRRTDATVQANVLVGRKTKRGSHVFEGREWDGKMEPLFDAALTVVKETLEGNRNFEWDLKPLFRLQMAYLLLWSAIERFTAFKFHLGKNVTEKIKRLATEPAFITGLQEVVQTPRVVFRADNPETKVTLNSNDSEKALEYYYQVRSNIIHRGKAAVHDHETLVKSLEELLELFQRLLRAEFSSSK